MLISFLFIFNNVEDNCQYWLNLKDMRLTSPNYPKWYFSGAKDCHWLLTAPESNIIALEFNDFEVITLPILYIYLDILENYHCIPFLFLVVE